MFLSYTNAVNPGDPVIQRLTNGTAPFGWLQATDVLRLGHTGTNLATGELNQPLPLSDPGSLKSVPNGSAPSAASILSLLSCDASKAMAMLLPFANG